MPSPSLASRSWPSCRCKFHNPDGLGGPCQPPSPRLAAWPGPRPPPARLRPRHGKLTTLTATLTVNLKHSRTARAETRDGAGMGNYPIWCSTQRNQRCIMRCGHRRMCRCKRVVGSCMPPSPNQQSASAMGPGRSFMSRKREPKRGSVGSGTGYLELAGI